MNNEYQRDAMTADEKCAACVKTDGDAGAEETQADKGNGSE